MTLCLIQVTSTCIHTSHVYTSLSLSHTHTYTYTHRQTHTYTHTVLNTQTLACNRQWVYLTHTQTQKSQTQSHPLTHRQKRTSFSISLPPPFLSFFCGKECQTMVGEWWIQLPLCSPTSSSPHPTGAMPLYPGILTRMMLLTLETDRLFFTLPSAIVFSSSSRPGISVSSTS